METMLIEKGVLAPGELDARLASELRPGQRVRVGDREHEGHHRTPDYLKGKSGTVERVMRRFATPRRAPTAPTGFPSSRSTSSASRSATCGPTTAATGDDRLYVDIFEHWLQEAG